MPARRLKARRPVVGPPQIPAWLWAWLIDDDDDDDDPDDDRDRLPLFLVDEADLWHQYRDQVIPWYVQNRPGLRPMGWWLHEAPREPRRRLAGKGTADFEALPAIVPEYRYGIPVRWIAAATIRLYRRKLGIKLRADPFDAKHPPVYESQATFLQRHGLLEPGEAALADFAPEVLPRQYWPD